MIRPGWPQSGKILSILRPGFRSPPGNTAFSPDREPAQPGVRCLGTEWDLVCKGKEWGATARGGGGSLFARELKGPLAASTADHDRLAEKIKEIFSMWMHEHYMWGFWWLFPLMGVVLFVLLIIVLVKVFGGAVPGSRKEIEDLRNEIRELKEEIEKLKKQGN